jgi:hypothetical protein
MSNLFDKRLLKLEEHFIARGFARALARARQAPMSDFAQVLADALPHDGRGTLWCDLDMLTDQELQLVAQWQP